MDNIDILIARAEGKLEALREVRASLRGERTSRMGTLFVAPENVRLIPAAVRAAHMAGYEGTACPSCGQLTIIRSGVQWLCDTCGAPHEGTAGAGVPRTK